MPTHIIITPLTSSNKVSLAHTNIAPSNTYIERIIYEKVDKERKKKYMQSFQIRKPCHKNCKTNFYQ